MIFFHLIALTATLTEPLLDPKLEAEPKILKVALIFEGAMVLSFFVFSYFDPSLSKLAAPTMLHFLLGVGSACLLFIFNLLFVFCSYKFHIVNSIKFKEGIVEPLSRALSFRGALYVSLLAGLGEELFFRGVLLPYTGLIFSSILFSVAHFLVEVKKYIFIASVYAGIGLLFGILFEYTGTLIVPIIFHVLYDFLAILFFKSPLKNLLRDFAVS